jgi:hypothetical protein
MLDASSAERPLHAADTAAVRALDVPARTRAVMVTMGFIPLLHVLGTLTPLLFAFFGAADWRAVWICPIVLFLVPPLVVRAATLIRPLPAGRVDIESRDFLVWWFSAQWQVVFTRLPFLEELLRLVPGLYSAWLRLWGARVGSFVYWSPGVAILDRPLVRIGSRVVFGIGVRLNGHVLAPGEDGKATLHIAPIWVGNDVLVGGYSLVLPGCRVADGEVTPPFRSLHPFSTYGGGRRRARSVPSGEGE